MKEAEIGGEKYSSNFCSWKMSIMLLCIEIISEEIDITTASTIQDITETNATNSPLDISIFLVEGITDAKLNLLC